MRDNLILNYKLIVSVVPKGKAKQVVSASKQAGAEGGTTILGRGTGIHEVKKLFGICIDPEKEVILTLIEDSKTDKVLSAIAAAGQLDKPCSGIAFVLNMKAVAGIVHLLYPNTKGAL